MVRAVKTFQQEDDGSQMEFAKTDTQAGARFTLFRADPRHID